ncbi:uncharacterized protein LOC112595700 isoform X2 [Melanaphis sacchari]|uniref:uncharacterized protein LOC112595700 isoform X2 n=1 Tax=Melanaphis sacchari TaxID=742174 RepID=UPI000DC13CEA|nr:uncharacterized protein LOC112595700 isoform X2 [Melanaphis sacchari]
MAEIRFLNLLPAEQVFVYNILSYRENKIDFEKVVSLEEENGLSCIKAHNNHASVIEGYVLKDDLYRMARNYYNNLEIFTKDLGISLLLVNFASYMAYNQYYLFAHDFNCIKELDTFEEILLKCSGNKVKLPFDIAIDRQWGLKSVERVMGKDLYTFDKFIGFIRFLGNKDITPEYFISLYVVGHHPRIVESLYAMASYKRSCSIINDCRRLNSNIFKYTIDRIVKVSSKTHAYNGVYWFRLPPGSKQVWFAATNDKVAFKGYMTRVSEHSIIEHFSCVKSLIIVGVLVNECTIYPIRVDNMEYSGKWEMMRDLFKKHNFNDVFNTGSMPSFAYSHFVINGKNEIYKYV